MAVYRTTRQLQVRQAIILALVLILMMLAYLASGADGFAQEIGRPGRLFAGEGDAKNPPGIELAVYGMDGHGAPLPINPTSITIRHDGRPAAAVEIAGSQEVGTFTLFLVDIPEGVADLIPAIQEAIAGFASEPTMKEQVDSIAIYRVGPANASELLAPTSFHNDVRNLFGEPLPPELGATALFDSTNSLLEAIDTLKPGPEMATAIVLISDGTDPISEGTALEDIPARAESLGVPIHTIWLANQDLTGAGQELGRANLAAIASGSRGLPATLDDPASLAAIWDRIASFREWTRLRYTVDQLAGGTFPIEVSLNDEPQVSAQSSVNLALNLPAAAILLSPENRQLQLPDLQDPVRLRLTTEVGWLDGVERQVQAAQLLVNGRPVFDIPPEEIGEFETDINAFFFGENTIQVALLDEQNLQATSPPLALQIVHGDDEVIPEELQPSGRAGSILRTLLVLLLIAAIAGGAIYVARSRGWLNIDSSILPRGRSKAGGNTGRR